MYAHFYKRPSSTTATQTKKEEGKGTVTGRLVGYMVVVMVERSSFPLSLSLCAGACSYYSPVHRVPFFYDFCPFLTNFTSAAAAAAAVCVLCWFIWHSSSSSQYKASNRRQQTGSNSSVIGVYNNILRNPTTICRTMSSLGGAECYVMGDVVAAFYTRVFLHAGVRGSFSPSVRG